MANTVGDGSAVCPFYHHESRLGIVCEGLIDGTVDMIRFQTEEEKERFRRMRCESFEYEQRCLIAMILVEKYGAAEEEK